MRIWTTGLPLPPRREHSNPWRKKYPATKNMDGSAPCGYKYVFARPDGLFPGGAQQTLLPQFSARRHGKTLCTWVLVLSLAFLAFILIRSCWTGNRQYAAAAPAKGFGITSPQAAEAMGYVPGAPVVAPKEQEVPLPPQQALPSGGVQCSITQGKRPPGPDAPVAMDGNVYSPRTDWGVLTQTAGKLPTSLTVKESNAGSRYETANFQPSAATMEFYNAFKPASINSLMPASWRGSTDQNCSVENADYNAGPTAKRYDEFSRYSISPMSAQHAEALRGTIRLSELSSTRNSKTLGVQSLLRNTVTPISPIPIGSTSYSWGDSDARLSMIAAATGSFPDEIGC